MGKSNEDKLKDAITVANYYNEYITPHEPTFRKMADSEQGGSGICPFHDDTDPSFHDWRDKKVFHCFGCGVSGDIIRLHQLTQQKYHNIRIDRKMAMESLALMYGIELEYDEVTGGLKEENIFEKAMSRFRSKEIKRNPKSMEKMTVAGFGYYNNQIKNNEHIREEIKISNYGRLDITYIAAKRKEG